MIDAPTAPPTEAAFLRLALFITGATPRSHRAVRNLQRFCETHLTAPYQLEVVDLYRSPHRASEAQVVAAPTLIRYTPKPRRIAIGDLSDTAVLKSLLMVA
jgi:circadian clock protein KaiB